MPISLTLATTYTRMNNSSGIEYTMQDVYQAVQSNSTYKDTMTKSTSGSYTVYTFVPYGANVYRQFITVSGSILRIQSNTKVVWNKTDASQQTVFQIGINGTLNVQPNVILDMSGTYIDGANTYYYGIVSMSGTSNSRITILHHRYNFIVPSNAQYYNYIDFIDTPSATSYDCYLQGSDAAIMPLTITNTNHYRTTGSGGNAFYVDASNWSNTTISNITVSGKSSGFIIFGGCIKIKDSIISNTSTYAAQVSSAGRQLAQPYSTSKVFNRPIDNRQGFVLLQNVTFSNCSTNAAIYAYLNTNMVLKDCLITRSDAVNRTGIYTHYASRPILVNTRLQNMSTNYIYLYSGTILHGTQNYITVLDNNSNPLQYANVSVYSANHAQNWSYLTDVNGKILNMYDGGLILVNKQQTAVNTFNNWCNTDTASTYHYIIASYPGYQTYTTRIDTNISNDITIRLTPIKTPIQPGDERMQYLIVEQLKTALQTIPQISFIGYYPYDYGYIINRLPCVLIKFGNTNVSSPDGLHTYDVIASTQFILYSNKGIEQSLDIEQSIITKIIETLHNNSTYCINGIADTAVQAGEINEYISPDTTGYNANILVRKIIQSYSFQKII